MAAHVLRHAQRSPKKIALSVVSAQGAQDWSYEALAQAVRGTATGLLQQGFTPGDHVLMRLSNTVDFPISYLGCIAAGLIPVPTSAQLTAPEVHKMVSDLRPAAILHAPGVAVPEGLSCPILSTAQLRAMHSLPPADFSMGSPDRPAYVIYTSGTSGQPRAVVHAHRALWARQMMFDGWYDLHPTDRLMHAGAFNWTFTLGTGLMDPWTMGATALIPAPNTPPADVPDLLHRHQATLFAAAPGVYRKMLKTAPRGALSALKTHLRHGLCAGEKLSEPMRRQWQDATGTAIHEAFGMSECSTFISANPTHPAPANTLGRPQNGRRVAILDPTSDVVAPVPFDTPGTIAIHKDDPGLMLGYLGAQEETQSRYHGPWFCTGDLGQMDPTGHITYLGRADDMMNAGGFRLSPLEVEAALQRFTGVHTVAVTDVDIKPGVSVIAAFYTADSALPDADLKAFAERQLARYKQPRIYQRLEALPTNANGKLNRGALRAIFKATS